MYNEPDDVCTKCGDSCENHMNKNGCNLCSCRRVYS